jgi:branched-chain amino acid transport system substrate-binding protein
MVITQIIWQIERGRDQMKKNVRARIFLTGFLAIFLGMLLSLNISPVRAEDAETVNIGFVFGITGPYATYGVPMRDAMDWALSEINGKGGFEVNGKKYKLNVIYYDHASKPEVEGPGLLKKALYSDKVPILFLGGSPITRISIPLLQRAKTPSVVILAGMLGVAEKSPYLFRIRPDASQCAPPMGAFFVDMGAKKFACIGADTDFSRDNIKLWKDIAKKGGGEIIEESYYAPGQVEDFYPILSKVKAANPDVVFVGGSTQQNALVYKQANEVGLNVPLGGYTGMTPEQAKDLIGLKYNDALKNVYDARGIDPAYHPDKRVRDWSKTFKEKFGYSPADLTMWAWDAPYLAIAAFQQANTVTDKDKLAKAFAEMNVPKDSLTPFIPVRNGKLFDENGQAYSTTVVLGWGKDKWEAKKYYSVVKGEIKEVK